MIKSMECSCGFVHKVRSEDRDIFDVDMGVCDTLEIVVGEYCFYINCNKCGNSTRFDS